MAENSKIEWTDHTFNPWTGCTKVSPGCDHCYAESWAKRSGTVRWGAGQLRRRTTDANWRLPVKWNAQAKLEGKRLRVFASSLADWLDLDAEISVFVDFLDLVRITLDLDWLLLSKRIGNLRKRLQEALDWISTPERMPERFALVQWLREWLDGKPPANVWIGSTVVNQEEADRDIPKLLQVPARVRFLSIEPMLGPVRIFDGSGDPHPVQTQRGIVYPPGALSWVIVGGESGPSARPMHPDWARSLRDQCKAAGVPFLFKQWGEWTPSVDAQAVQREPDAWVNETTGEVADEAAALLGGRWQGLWRIGKKLAGRQLDGVQHDRYPA